MRSSPRLSRFLIYLLGILAAMTLTVVLVYVVMNPPMADLQELVLVLSLTSLGSAILGFVSYRLGWWKRVRSLTLTLTLGYILAALLTLFNVWLTARLMFFDQHDLALATLLLLFAGGISVFFGYFLSSSVTQTLRDLDKAAGRLQEGDFSARVEVTGENEVARLAQSFNVMVARLEQAQEAERSLESARRNLVAWASHDLRTPLASLRALIDAMADGVVQDPQTIARYLELSQNEINRMSSLIDDLFELAQIDAGKMEIFCENSSLLDLISDTLEGFSVRAEARGITLNGSVSPQVDPVWMAPEKISRVLHNLLDNALRHTPPGGKVDLEAGVEGQSVLVVVQDTGEGIPEQDLDHVFDRFFRGEESRTRDDNGDGGAGLGLAIAKGLVEAHGGRIWAESMPGMGTRLAFELPKSP
ncbi:MAG: HAMP domain-containing sensor histidine kinase [Anaerolineales bacterium]|nr:HAMP domain-containing sensor histidine kinase [Anaerolineales bacterium]